MYGIFMECYVAFKLYIGTWPMLVAYLSAIIYLLLTEKDRSKRIFLVWVPLLIQIGFFLPITKMAYVKFFSDSADTYYRLMWLIPMYVIIAYAACVLIQKHKRVGLVAIAALIVVFGSLVYQNQYVTKAENAYHIPQYVIDVCDEIKPDEGDPRVRAVFPAEMIHYVRQYTTDILMPYGREMVETQWDYYDPVYEQMEKVEVVDARQLIRSTREFQCHYIVLSVDKKVDDDLTALGYELINTVDGYNIYYDQSVPAVQ